MVKFKDLKVGDFAWCDHINDITMDGRPFWKIKPVVDIETGEHFNAVDEDNMALIKIDDNQEFTI